MTAVTLQGGGSFQALNSVVIPRSTKLHLHSHKSSRAWGWGITTCLVQALRPVLCVCFRRERKWTAKKKKKNASPSFPPIILQKKKRLKALLEWLHWLPWLPWASICKTDRRENPSSTPLPCNSWKWHLCSAAGKITCLSLIFLPCHSQFPHDQYHNINF